MWALLQVQLHLHILNKRNQSQTQTKIHNYMYDIWHESNITATFWEKMITKILVKYLQSKMSLKSFKENDIQHISEKKE
jgi:hypothetical protein